MSKRDDYLGLARTDLEVCADNLGAAVARMMAARPGVPGAASYDGPSVSGGGSSLTPTERAADQRMRGDRTQADIDQMDRALREIGRYALVLRRIVESWTPHAPTDRDKRDVERANDPTPECALCRMHANVHEPVHRSGRCRWCYDFAKRIGRVPAKEELQRHHDGLQVRVKA